MHHINIRAFDTYLSKASYRPQTCGAHTLHVVSRLGSARPEESSRINVYVTIDPVKAVQQLIDVTLRADISPEKKRKLLRDLDKAKRAFPLHVGQGLDALRKFIREVGTPEHGRQSRDGELSEEDANLLSTLAARIIGCV